ncbi:MAG TPA: ATP-binding cassette domain-containing protein [Gammaproteobacteria bacterium]|jgi:Fe-S cluster assembly ATP-binding protein
MDPLIAISDLWVEVGGKSVLRGLDLQIPDGEVHILFGPNGSGKSTLLSSIMGLPGYRITRGTIAFRGKRIDGLETNAIARLGIGLAFQHPPAIRGVALETFIRSIDRSGSTSEAFQSLHLDSHRKRELNCGFSGGELKRSEILKLTAQSPELILLDEPESGVDLENLAIITEAINRILDKQRPLRLRRRGGLIISHAGFILDYVEANLGHIILDGRIACSGNPHEMFEEIRKEGYEHCVQCLATRPGDMP